MQITHYDATEWNEVAETGTREKILHELTDTPLGEVRMTVRHYDTARDVKVHRHKIEQIRYVLNGDSGPILGQPCPVGTVIYVGASTFYGNYHREGNVDYLSFKLGSENPTIPFPKLRIPCPIQLNPENFAWRESAPGVVSKALVSLTERETAISMLGIDGGSEYTFDVDKPALFFVSTGQGLINDQPLRLYDAIAVEKPETVRVASTRGIELLSVVLPEATLN